MTKRVATLTTLVVVLAVVFWFVYRNQIVRIG